MAKNDVAKPVAVTEAVANVKYVRISSRKVSILLDLIRGKNAKYAMGILKNTPKSASLDLAKLLKSAMANAENNFHMDADSLYVSRCFVSEGPILKRIMPRAQGRSFRIYKRTSHITIAVKQKEA